MQQDSTLFSGGLLFDGVNPPVADHAVLVRGQRIERVAPDAEFTGYDGPRVDTAGGTLMPGLIDAHVHLTFGAEPDMVAVVQRRSLPDLALATLENARATLAGGITAARDCGGRDFVEIAVRDAIDGGRQQGPSLRCAGRLICMTGGHGRWIGREADGVEEVRKAVRETIRGGADCVKIMATGGVLTPGDPLAAHFLFEEIAAGIAEAQRLGVRVASHAQGAVGIDNAVRGGVDSIEHGFELTEALIAAMIEGGVYLVPTLSASAMLLGSASDAIPAHSLAKARRYRDMHEDSVRRYIAAGGLVAMGTDAGTPFNRHGENAGELAHLVRLGMAPHDALRSGTSLAADLLDMPERGRIRDGAFADLLVVEGDPSRDIAAAADRAHHRLIVKNGRAVTAAALAAPIDGIDHDLLAARQRAAARVTVPDIPTGCCWGEHAHGD